MPQRKAAIKRLRADKTRHLHNLRIKIDLKKTLKKFRALLVSQKYPEAQDALKGLISKLDKAQAKGIIHKNTVARKKSQLMLRLKILSKKPAGKD